MKIYGICGCSHSGKDTIASIIKKNTNNTEIFSFAEPLKGACQKLFNLSEEQLHNHTYKEKIDKNWGISPRQMFQWLGTEIMRKQFDEDFFIKNMKNRIEKSDADCIIISDIRFINELLLIKELGGIIIKVIRPNAETTPHTTHASEQDLPNDLIDHIIINDKDVEELGHKIKTIIR